MIVIKRASELDFDIRSKMAELFVEGFGQWLTYFSKDNEKLKAVFNHIFFLHKFFIAIDNDKVVGMSGCAESTESTVELNRREFGKHLGFFKGTISYYLLKHEFCKTTPGANSGTGSIEFVATSKEHRGRGIATALIKHIISEADYNEFILEVADTNIAAVNLYTGIGFKEYARIKQKYSRKTGVNYLVYLKYIKTKK
ncbi:MAG TPA: GNAT family N-acetyltransferase [Chitinispirillaceae bacterium]|nr:GNAT family N-acetyltransferase [Chitinispirillaceae bacterium]